MNGESINSDRWSSSDVQACSDQTRGIFTDTLHFLVNNYCPNYSQAITAAAILTLAMVGNLNRAQCVKEQAHE